MCTLQRMRGLEYLHGCRYSNYGTFLLPDFWYINAYENGGFTWKKYAYSSSLSECVWFAWVYPWSIIRKWRWQLSKLFRIFNFKGFLLLQKASPLIIMWSAVILYKQTFHINRLDKTSLLGNECALKWIVENYQRWAY